MIDGTHSGGTTTSVTIVGTPEMLEPILKFTSQIVLQIILLFTLIVRWEVILTLLAQLLVNKASLGQMR